MAFRFFKNSLKEKKYFLAINVRNESVSSAVVETALDEKPAIIFFNKFFFTVGNLNSENEYFQNLLRCLEVSLKDLFEKNRNHKELKIENVFFSFSSLFSFFRIEYQKLEFDKNTFFSKAFSEELLDNFAIDLKSDVKKQKNMELRITDKFITQAKLNGYQVVDPYGRAAKRFEIGSFLSAIPESLFEKVQALTEKFFHIEKINVYSEDFTLYNFISNFLKQDDFIILSVNNLLTKTTVVNNRGILENKSVFFGVNDISNIISENISKKNNDSFAFESDKRAMEIMSLFEINKRGDMDRSFSKIFESSAKQATKAWMNEVENYLKNLENKTQVNSVYLFADERLRLFLRDSQLSLSKMGNSAKIAMLDSDSLSHFCGIGEKIIYEPTILPLILFSDKIIKDIHLS